MKAKVWKIMTQMTEIMNKLSFPEFLFLMILITGVLLIPPSRFTPLEYIKGIIKLGIVYGWFVFLMVILYLIVDVPEKWKVSIYEWVASLGAFGIITSLILWGRKWPLILKALITILIAYLWSYLTIRILKHIDESNDKQGGK